MPEIKLPEMFCTIGIGFYAFTFLIYFFYLVFSLLIDFEKKSNLLGIKSIREFFEKEEFSKTGIAIIAIVLVYGLGALIQDSLTGSLKGGKEGSNCSWDITKQAGFETSKEIRSSVLFTEDRGKLSPIGHIVFGNDSLMTVMNKLYKTSYFNSHDSTYEDLEKEWEKIRQAFNNQQSGEEKKKLFYDFADQIYYTSKNWCYLYSTNAYNELKEIQQKMDFAECIGLLSYVFLFAFGMLLIIYCIRYFFYGTENKIKIEKILFNLICSLIFIFITLHVCRNSYRPEIDNFNKRVYSYYVTNFINKDIAKPNVIK